MDEYRIIDNTPPEAQKKLNQWRHDYDIDIISMSSVAGMMGCTIQILIKRTPKKK